MHKEDDSEVYKSLTQEIKYDAADVKNQRKSTFLYISAFAANLTYFAFGCNLVWTSPVIAKLKSADVAENPLGTPITAYEVSLIAGLPFCASIIGPLLLGRTCDIIGRRNVLVVASIVTLLSYVLLAFTTSVYCYFLARLLLGICQSTSSVALPIFTSEITEKHNRGKFGVFMSLSVVCGSFYGFSIGPFLSIRNFSLMCAAPMVVCMTLLTLVVPESPYFLVAKGKMSKALRALEKLRNSTDVAAEYKEIERTLREKAEDNSNVYITLFKDPVSRKAFVINIALILFQVLSGTTVILAFVGPLFDSTDSGLSGNVVAIIVGIVKVISFGLTSAIVERAGRKRLLLISSIGSATMHTLLGIFFYAKDHKYSFVNKVAWLPILLVLLFMCLYALGLGPIQTVVLSELQPSETKSVAASFVTSIGNVTAFAVTSGFPFVSESFGHYTCFWIFAVSCIIGAIYVQCFVIETKGKTLREIQEMLKALV